MEQSIVEAAEEAPFVKVPLETVTRWTEERNRLTAELAQARAGASSIADSLAAAHLETTRLTKEVETLKTERGEHLPSIEILAAMVLRRGGTLRIEAQALDKVRKHGGQLEWWDDVKTGERVYQLRGGGGSE